MMRSPSFPSVLVGLAFTAAPGMSQKAPQTQASPRAQDLRVRMTGTVLVNGQEFSLTSQGIVNQATGNYSLKLVEPDVLNSRSICPLEGALAALIPRTAMKFLVYQKDANRGALFRTDAQALVIELSGAPKRDLVSGLNRLFASIEIRPLAKGVVAVHATGAVNTTSSLCAGLENADGMYGHSVLRLGIKPTQSAAGQFTGGSFVGIARVDLEVPGGDSGGVGHSDFWNLDGAFYLPSHPRIRAEPVASVDVGHIEQGAAMTGVISNFPGTTVPMRAVLTIAGTATRDGFIHQHMGVSNGRGGGPALTHFDVPVKAGDSPAAIAARVAQGMNQSSAGFLGGGHALAVQGGTGVGVARADTTSPRIAFCDTVDGKSCAEPTDPAAMLAFLHIMPQLFGDAGFPSFMNSGVTETFGVLGEPPLVGWLTPFKVVIFTDNPATGLRAAGGELTVRSNTCSSSNGRYCDQGAIRTSPAVTIKTFAGETPDDIARDLVKALNQVGTKCIQRVGNIVYMDAGLEMQSTLTVGSGDAGVGLMSAAADLPTLADPHPNIIPPTGR